MFMENIGFLKAITGSVRFRDDKGTGAGLRLQGLEQELEQKQEWSALVMGQISVQKHISRSLWNTKSASFARSISARPPGEG